jgi:hypothetical protein
MTIPNDQPDQQKDVIADYANEIQQRKMTGYERTVRKARNALFWAGGLIFVGEMISMVMTNEGFDPIIFTIGLFEGGIFVALALWTKKKPYTAIVTGFIVFVSFIILSMALSAMVDGAGGAVKALVSGYLVKLIIIMNLIRPLKDAKALEDAKKQNF